MMALEASVAFCWRGVTRQKAKKFEKLLDFDYEPATICWKLTREVIQNEG